MADTSGLLTLKVDRRLATAYRDAYMRAFVRQNGKREPLATFIADFVEDRLAEEIEFAEREEPHKRK